MNVRVTGNNVVAAKVDANIANANVVIVDVVAFVGFVVIVDVVADVTVVAF